MFQWIVLVLSILILIIQQTVRREGYIDPNSYDIIIVAGQSNAVGFSYEASIDTNVPNINISIPTDKNKYKFYPDELEQLPNLYILGRDPAWPLRPVREDMLNKKEPSYMSSSDEIIQACEPMSYHSTSWNPQASIGFYRTFAKNYLATNPGRKVLIVNNAYEAVGLLTPLTNKANGRASIQWDVGGELYNTLVSRVKKVLEWNPNNKVVAILWSQGEADIDNNSVTTAQYITALRNFITSLRTAINPRDVVPFLACGYSQDWHTSDNLTSKKNDFMSNLQSLSCTTYNGQYPVSGPGSGTIRSGTIRSGPSVIPKFGYVSTTGVTSDKLTINNNVHFNFAGLRELGERFWRVYSVIR